MATDIRSISQVGTSEPFELQVSRNQINAHQALLKFGSNSNVANVEETIWDGSSSYSYLESATVLKISSSSTADTSDGTGARTVEVFGLDANYLEINETVTLNGQTAVNTTNSFLRVFRIIVRSAGSGGENAGIIYAGTGAVSSGVPANVYAQVIAGENQTLMALYTVPAGKSLYINELNVTSGTETGTAFIVTKLKVRPLGEVFQTKNKSSFNDGYIDIVYSYPFKVEEKSDIEITAICSKNQLNVVSGFFSGVLLQEQGPL